MYSVEDRTFIRGKQNSLMIINGRQHRNVFFLETQMSIDSSYSTKSAGPVSVIGSASRITFWSSQARFPGPAHSFTMCQLLVKGRALSTG